MKNLNFKEQVLPHLVAIVLFLLMTVIFYKPLFFENKALTQHDVTQGLGGGQESREYRESTGEEALWSNSMFGGMPTYLVNMYWDGNLLRFMERVMTAGFSSTPGVTFTSFLTFYFLLLVFGVRPYLAMGGAVAFGLSSFHIISIGAGHIWKVRAISYMPLVLAGVHLLFKNGSKKLYGLAILAVGFALEIKANHLQITYYLLIMLLIYGASALIFSIKNNELPALLKNVGLVIVAGVIAIGCNIGQLWATYEYSQYSTRGPSDLTASGQSTDSGLDKEYVFRWSSGRLESLMLLVPNIYGGSSTESLLENPESKTLNALRRSNNPQAQQLARYASGYWGEQPGTSPIYIGAIVCFLFLLGMLIADNRIKYWILASVVLSLMLSWGHNFSWFNDFMYNYFPMYNKFRAVTMVLVIALMLIPLLAFVGLEKAFTMSWKKDIKKNIVIALGGTAGLCLIFIVAPGIFDFTKSFESQLPEWLTNAMILDRKSILRQDAFRSLIFISLVAAVLFFYLKGKLTSLTGALIIVAIVTVDLWSVDRRYLNHENYKRKSRNNGFVASEANQLINQDPSLNFRVLNLIGTWSEAETSYFHASIGGYHGAKVRRYQELIEHCIDNQKNEVINQLQSGSRDFSNVPVLNMLNTRYLKFGDQTQQVIKNIYAYGNAWVSNKIVKVNSADEEIGKVCELIDNQTTIIDSNSFSTNSFEGVKGSILLTDYAPNKLTYKTTLDGNGLIVFSEIYYPKGWKAFVDGQEVEILRANYILRALDVPEGTHVIEFRFEPKAYFIGNNIMYASSALLIGLFLFTLVVYIRPLVNGKKD